MVSSPRGPRSRLRIVHLTTSGDIVAGAEQLLLGMARTARVAEELAWTLEFCTLTAHHDLGHGSLHHCLAENGWPVHSLGMRGLTTALSGLRRLRALLVGFEPDIVHTHLSHASLVGAVAAVLHPRTLLIQTRHYTDYIARFRPRRVFADAWAARRSDHIIAVSDAAKAQLVTREGVRSERVSVVENGVDWGLLAALDHRDGRRRLDALGASSGFTIGCAASFNSHKGHSHLLQAMAIVRARHPEACLVLLGTGPEESVARAEAERLGLSRCVHFLGHRADAHALMAGLDLYVQPSVTEGFGLAVLEAMAMRLPVVVTAVGGMLKTVEPERSGLRVPPADPQAMADAIVMLVKDRARADALGTAASERIRRLYSIGRMVESYDEVYRSVLAAAEAPEGRSWRRARSPFAHVRSMRE